MFRVITRRRLDQLLEVEADVRSDARDVSRLTRELELEQLRGDVAEQTLEWVRADAAKARAMEQTEAFDADVTVSALRAELDKERRAAAVREDELQAELDSARAQVLLDAEDRVALRALLRTVRRQEARKEARAYLLWRRGELHSVHGSMESAEGAAEEEGASQDGWVAHSSEVPLPPASEVAWRVQQMPLGGAR